MCPYIILHKNTSKQNHSYLIHYLLTQSSRLSPHNKGNISYYDSTISKSLKTASFLCSILNLRAWKHEPSSVLEPDGPALLQGLMWYVLPAEHFWLPKRHSKWTYPHAANELQQNTLKDAVLFGALLWNLHRPPTICLTTIILVNQKTETF